MPDATLDASYQAYNSVEIAGFVGWIRRSRRIRSRAQLPDAMLDVSYQAYKSVENAGFVRHIRHINHDAESVVQMPTPHYPLQYFRFQLR